MGAPRKNRVFGLILLLIVVVGLVISALMKQKTRAVPFTFAGFTNSVDYHFRSPLALSISNWVELHYYDSQTAQKVFHGQEIPYWRFRQVQGFRMGGGELFAHGQWGLDYYTAGNPYPYWRMKFAVPVTLPQEPWRLRLQIQGDLPGRTNRLKAFVRSFGHKCGFNMVEAEWLDSSIWVDIPGKP